MRACVCFAGGTKSNDGGISLRLPRRAGAREERAACGTEMRVWPAEIPGGTLRRHGECKGCSWLAHKGEVPKFVVCASDRYRIEKRCTRRGKAGLLSNQCLLVEQPCTSDHLGHSLAIRSR
jgi:hypothetical protein